MRQLRTVRDSHYLMRSAKEPVTVPDPRQAEFAYLPGTGTECGQHRHEHARNSTILIEQVQILGPALDRGRSLVDAWVDGATEVLAIGPGATSRVE